MGVVVRAPVEAEWVRVRDLRLAMIDDAPEAFSVTAAQTLMQPASHWRARARGRADGSALAMVAVDTVSGAWVGGATGIRVPDDARPHLVAVWVAPAWRGLGVLDQLLAPIEAWAGGVGDELWLEVQEANVRALRAYERRGFVLTGASSPHVTPPYGVDLEMVKRLH